MDDREKLVNLMWDKAREIAEWGGEILYLVSPEKLADHLIANGVTMAGMQRPLTLEQVKENRAVWIEDDGCETGEELYPALYYAEGYPQHTVFTYLDEDRGEEDAWLNNTEYGITWRCWATKPTEEERANAEWEEGVNDGD